MVSFDFKQYSKVHDPHGILQSFTFLRQADAPYTRKAAVAVGTMNLNLIDPFVLAQDYPETAGQTLKSGHATCVRFNRKGDLLASGRVDGVVIIFDMDTYGVARKLRGHTKQIQSFSWSRDGRYLLSGSQDWRCILWDLLDGSVLREVRFESPVYIAELHPNNHLMFVAALYEDQPMLVDIATNFPVKHSLKSAPKRLQSEADEQVDKKQAAQDAKMATTVAIFAASGHHILAGTNKGWLNIIDVATYKTIYSTKLVTGHFISLRLTASGRDMVVNAQDRIIRTIQLPNLSLETLDPDEIHIEVEHKFQDVVNRLSWNHVAFSSTGEFVTATTYMNHDIYIWERQHGSLVKILEGAKGSSEEHGTVEWHPHKPLIVAIGLETGRIHTWTVTSPQRWSALAPDFVEVEENVEYIERDDEFDVIPKAEIQNRQLLLEDDPVDVLTIEPTKGETADDRNAFQMPILFDISESEDEDEFVQIGLGTMRRKNPNEGKDYLEDGGSGDERSGIDRVKNGIPKTKRR